MKISKHSVVSLEYTLTDDQDEVLDQSDATDPLVYLHGTGALVPGLEQALEGKSAGETFQVSIAPGDAYGHRNEKWVQELKRSEFPEDEELEEGMVFQLKNGSEDPAILTIVELKDDTVTVDGNHPLAGMTLHFDVKVTEVRPATEEELEHGHAHSGCGHEHGHDHHAECSEEEESCEATPEGSSADSDCGSHSSGSDHTESESASEEPSPSLDTSPAPGGTLLH